MQTPYEIMGERGIRDVVAEFYRLMDSEPAYEEIRASSKPQIVGVV